MKVILLQDVAKVGKKHEIKEVADGFAINSLFPKKLARESTPGAIKQIGVLKAQAEAEHRINEDLLVKNLEGLEGKEVVLVEKANEQGHLFAAVKGEEIAKAVKESLRVDVSPSFIDLPEHIKAVGEYTITVLVQGKKAKFKLQVKAK